MGTTSGVGQNPVGVRKEITTGLCKNPRPNIYLYQCKYLERIYHALSKVTEFLCLQIPLTTPISI